MDERKQIGIDFVRVNDRHTMREARVDLELRIFHQLDRECSRIWKGHDLVVVAMHDEGGNVDLLQVFGKVGLGKGLDAVLLSLEASLHPLIPEIFSHPFGDLCTLPVIAEKGQA